MKTTNYKIHLDFQKLGDKYGVDILKRHESEDGEPNFDEEDIVIRLKYTKEIIFDEEWPLCADTEAWNDRLETFLKDYFATHPKELFHTEPYIHIGEGFECPHCEKWVEGSVEGYRQLGYCPHCKSEIPKYYLNCLTKS